MVLENRLCGLIVEGVLVGEFLRDDKRIQAFIPIVRK